MTNVTEMVSKINLAIQTGEQDIEQVVAAVENISGMSEQVNRANLEQSCGRCHSGFQARFLSYQAHPDYKDRAKYPSLYVTFLFMTALLVGTLVFFWVHTFLWWRKDFWEKRELRLEASFFPLRTSSLKRPAIFIAVSAPLTSCSTSP
jgi:hypothetical protein